MRRQPRAVKPCQGWRFVGMAGCRHNRRLMNPGYFNYVRHLAADGRGRRAFLRAWWALYASDRRWIPPLYPGLGGLFAPAAHPHLSRLDPAFLHLEALPRARRGPVRLDPPGLAGTPMFEQPVAAGLLWRDPRADKRTAHLGLWRTVNDDDGLERYLEVAFEHLWFAGVRRLVGPVGLSPYLGGGVLADHWDLTPPLHTPYAPPYQAELASRHMDVLAESRLWWLPVPSDGAPPGRPCRPLASGAFPAHLLPVWLDTPPLSPPLPALDEAEARYLWEWWSRFPLLGWEAWQEDRPVGFVFLQPDLGPLLSASRGGRPWWGRALWAMRRGHGASQGRLLCLAVAPAARGRGVGRALLAAAMATARGAGWAHLAVGPLPADHPGAGFLRHIGAAARETYRLFVVDRS